MQSKKINTGKKRQPTILKPPGTAHPLAKNLSQTANRAVLDIAGIFAAPPDLTNIGIAMKNVAASLNSALLVLPDAIGFIGDFIKGLQSYGCENVDIQKQDMGLAGRKLDYPEWDLITKHTDSYQDDVQLLIGLELISAYLLQKRFAAKLAVNINRITKSESLVESDKLWIIGLTQTIN